MADIPEHILRRSAEARAKKEGRPVDEILAEMKGATEEGDRPEEAASPEAGDRQQATGDSPKAETSSSSPSGGGVAGGGGGGQGLEGAALLAVVAEARGMPESLTERSAKARAKKEGSTVEAVLQEWAAEAGLNVRVAEAATPVPPDEGRGDAEERSDDAGGQPPAAGTPTGAALPMPARVPTPDSTQVAATAAIATIDGGADHSDAKSDRLLTVIRAGEVQRIRSEPTDRVNVWPHLLAIEFVALLVVLILLITLAVFLEAPLLEFANFNEQPNPSKAPWYFLGLQELLAYFDPQVAGIIIPGFGLAALALIPYIDKNPSVRPSHRKLAIMIFTFFIMAAAVLTIFGSFFRGPGFNFTYPWHDGIFFDDLKSLLG